MSMLDRLTTKGKVVVGIFLTILVVGLVIGILVISNSPGNTVKVGKSSFEQNSRAYPEYKTGSGSRLTILNSELLRPYLSEVAISRLETNLKDKLYEKNTVIPSVGSITSKVKANENGPLEFTIKIDTDDITYKVLANTDGSIVEISTK